MGGIGLGMPVGLSTYGSSLLLIYSAKNFWRAPKLSSNPYPCGHEAWNEAAFGSVRTAFVMEATPCIKNADEPPGVVAANAFANFIENLSKKTAACSDGLSPYHHWKSLGSGRAVTSIVRCVTGQSVCFTQCFTSSNVQWAVLPCTPVYTFMFSFR